MVCVSMELKKRKYGKMRKCFRGGGGLGKFRASVKEVGEKRTKNRTR